MLRASTVWVACFTALGATGNEDSALDSPRFPLAHRLVKWVYWTFIASQPSYLLVCLQCFYSQLKMNLPLILQSAKGVGWLIEKSTLSQIEPVTAKVMRCSGLPSFFSLDFFSLHQTFFSQRTEVHVVCNTLKISYDIDLASIFETKQCSWTDILHLESLNLFQKSLYNCTSRISYYQSTDWLKYQCAVKIFKDWESLSSDFLCYSSKNGSARNYLVSVGMGSESVIT